MLPPVALVIHSLHTFELTDDGQYLMLNGDQLDSIALHHSVMHQLLAAVSNAIGWSRRIRQNENDMRYAMPCEAWAIGKDKGEATHLVLTFRLPGGAELSFRMHRADARQMTEVLSQVTGLAKVNCASGVTLQ
ncbi:hypothetical protein [Paraburkholderia fungorum]|jgi:hypothetical protein|uniref:hypothetical protein n=1 Tax=Paraburkholderia fungorum TaxID=134537 RepID=UPI0004115DD5|nr:hypothetical protein [Paraburkholderia fungorum]PZR47917.1 MAG: hypothetical protein DI523_12715 [Paraburkholderia fungorum]QLD51971.1 hypothetical protein C9419_23710 [Paraburkholderia fungorum]